MTLLAPGCSKPIHNLSGLKNTHFPHICKSSMRCFCLEVALLHMVTQGTQASSTLWLLLFLGSQSFIQFLMGGEQKKGKAYLLLIHSDHKGTHIISDHVDFMKISCTATPRFQETVHTVPHRQPLSSNKLTLRIWDDQLAVSPFPALQPLSDCMPILPLTSRMTGCPEIWLHFDLRYPSIIKGPSGRFSANASV